ncbi:hypothetical protein Cylst_3354 [Cylindrospermum stagnale PCC 7417]|uniref:Uncharacterized protein n=1 Tax=Cylindrospermum stagnale PCC 7417 TaxID=56107 RepID=K9X0C8_9NOST|nr:hypothetical protein [Cylindrospermum stagnale]AFZ25506.1 hypothetical protein Cylst_3354 [Cylindrospermum stagnale PCC 7417]
MTCEWVDLSPTGDRSIIQKFDAEDSRDFFNATPPTIRIVIDAPLEHEANFALAGADYQIAQEYQLLKQPPSIESGRRRTVFTVRVDNDEALLPTAYVAILPFQDAIATQNNIYAIAEIIKSQVITPQDIKSPHLVEQLTRLIEEAMNKATIIKQTKKNLEIAAKLNFVKVPTQTILTNSSAHTLMVHDNPNVRKRWINHSSLAPLVYNEISRESTNNIMPSLNMIIDFVKGSHNISQ